MCIIAEALCGEQPNALPVLERLAVLVFQLGRAGEAASLFAQVVTSQPTSARAHANLGEALRLVGRLDQAHLHLKRAVALDPAFPQAWNSLGLLAFATGRHADAERAYRESIRLRPRFAAAHINLGNTLHVLGRGRDAAVALREALRIEPNSPLALLNLGQVLSATGDSELLDEAETVCRRAIALAPGLAQAASILEKIVRLRVRLDPAVAYDTGELRPDPHVRNAGVPIDPLGRQRELRDRSAPAEETAGIWSDCHSAESHFKRGVSLLRESRHDEAEACFRAALRVDPTLATAWVGLSQLQAERGDIDLSCQSARSALALCPVLAEAHWRLATTLRGRLADDDVRAIEPD